VKIVVSDSISQPGPVEPLPSNLPPSFDGLTPEEQRRDLEIIRKCFGDGKTMRDTVRVDQQDGSYMLVTRERPWPKEGTDQASPHADH
jgi:hypothetical protein